MSRFAALSVFSAILVLSGCTPTKTLILQPTQLGSVWVTNITTGFWCNFSIQSNGLGPPDFSAGPGQVMIGLADWYDGGSGPFPCVQNSDSNALGGILFDLSQFDVVGSSSIGFSVLDSLASNGEVTNQNPPASYANTLGMGTADPSNWVSAGLPFNNQVSIGAGPSFFIGVLDQVQAWVNHSQANDGFVLAGPRIGFPGSPPNDNVTNLSWYGNFQLTVVYDPTRNPRAPQ